MAQVILSNVSQIIFALCSKPSNDFRSYSKRKPSTYNDSQASTQSDGWDHTALPPDSSGLHLPASSPCPHPALAPLTSLFLSQACTLLPQGLCSCCSLCLEHKRSINKYLLNRLIGQVVAYTFLEEKLTHLGQNRDSPVSAGLTSWSPTVC